jgi:phage tail protein X
MSKTYNTRQGDTWDRIALDQMGSEKYMSLLIEANSKYNQVVVFPAEVPLVIPAVPVVTAATLPPWKR